MCQKNNFAAQHLKVDNGIMTGNKSDMYYFKTTLENFLLVTKKKPRNFQSQQPIFVPNQDDRILLYKDLVLKLYHDDL